MKKTFTFNQFLTIINNKGKLKDLRDDDAISAWNIMNRLRDKFRDVNDQFQNIMSQITALEKQTQQTRLNAEKKAEELESEQEKEKLLEDAKRRNRLEFQPKLNELTGELEALKDKEAEVEFEPLSTAMLKEYELQNFDVLETFNLILNDSPDGQLEEEPKANKEK